MVIDSSAVIAILYLEPEAPALSKRFEADSIRLMSAATMMETGMVLVNRSEALFKAFEKLLDTANIEIIPVDENLARLAIDAFRRYGKGRHAARLNYGDCFSYALAKQMGEPLLCKGDDFAKTDIEVA
jgi:ribonuclease VapC